MKIETILQHNGFSAKEAAVYLATLELGMAPISVVARKSGLKRSTASEILQRLSEKGIAEFFVRKKTRYYSVLSPKSLLQRQKDSVGQLETVIPELAAIHNEVVHKPRITFYEGKGDLQRLYLDCLLSKGEICNYFQPDATVEYFGMEWLQSHMMRKLVDQKMDVRVIMPSTPLAARFKKARESGSRQQRITTKAPFQNEVVIYDDKVAHFSFGDDFAFLIQSKDVADTHRAIFELAWESLPA
jgi:hypothetical protein